MDNDLMTGYIMGNSDASCNNRGGLGNVGDLAELLIVAGLFGGGGWGFGGGFGGGGGMMMNGIATRADINEGFALNNITGGITAIQQGICDSTYALNNAITNGFHGVDRGLCDVSHAISDCCCTTQNAIQNVRYDISTGLCNLGNAISTQTRDLNDTIRDGFARMEAQSNARYIAELERKLNICDRDSALQGLGTYLINTLRPSPIPAYQSCNPWAGNGGNWNGCNHGGQCFN